ncbi:hypothetical protein STAS_32053 [Striga asiatica]|uniref:Uncharacterized protein n=1 Tax=Striga asiatica TaxID=4170 RepID=A0A5A7RAX7_STRAF|nr:hypothetical protein STAS_32053 [Striga asiatica]
MANSEEQQSLNGGCIDDEDPADQISDAADLYPEGGAETSEPVTTSVTRRLTEIFLADGDGDLLLQSSDPEGGFLQWFHALDMQVMGACRGDERLKPLLKLNVAAGVAEDGLLAHLVQHFEPSEVGLIASCLCVPLVSIRVGRIDKQGALMSPTSIRLFLTWLFASKFQTYHNLPLDRHLHAGFCLRSLLLDMTEVRMTCEDTGKVGVPHDLISHIPHVARKPWHLMGNLHLTLLPTSALRVSFNGDDGSVERLATLSTEVHSSNTVMEEIPSDKSGRSFLIKTPDNVSYFWCSEKSKLLGDELLRKMKDLLVTKPSLAELTGISESRLNYFASHLRAYLTDTVLSSAQASGLLLSNLEDDSDSYSDLSSPQSPSNFPKSLCQVSKTNLIYLGSLSPNSGSFEEGLQKNSSSLRSAAAHEENYMRCVGSQSLASLNCTILSGPTCFPKDNITETSSSIAHSFPALDFLDVLEKSVPGQEIKIPSSSTLSPQYCWCPPVVSVPIVLATEPFSLPPLSSLLSKPLVNVAELPPLDFPTLDFPLANSRQLPTFTPLMCDPIVHVPVIDVCSSGYLATSLAGAESEKGARETLRMLVNGSSSQGSNVEQNVFGGLYSGTRDVVAASMSAAATTVGLVLLSEKRCLGRDNLVIDHKEKPSGSGSGSSEFD